MITGVPEEIGCAVTEGDLQWNWFWRKRMQHFLFYLEPSQGSTIGFMQRKLTSFMADVF